MRTKIFDKDYIGVLILYLIFFIVWLLKSSTAASRAILSIYLFILVVLYLFIRLPYNIHIETSKLIRREMDLDNYIDGKQAF